MKFAILLLFAFAGLTAAEEARPQEAAPASAIMGPTPWLGLTVGRLDDAIRAQVPELPPGIGFMITTVEAGSPAEKAGLKRLDILWRLDDQWIANQAQLSTLLRLRKEGDQTKLAVFRMGKSLDLSVTLGRLPEDHLHGKLPSLTADELSEVPMKVMNPAASTAEISAPDGKAILTISSGVKEVKILSSDGVALYQGPMRDGKNVLQVPDPWKIRVLALERTLANRVAAVPVQRPPRMRLTTTDSAEAAGTQE
jgi:hypothetical protein